jgi:hypothetical protein
MMFFPALLILCLIVLGASFRARIFPKIRVSSSSSIRCDVDDDSGAPSDTTIDDPMTFDSVMLSEGPAKAFFLGDCSSLSRLELNEYVLALEKINPTEDPAYSSKLNG